MVAEEPSSTILPLLFFFVLTLLSLTTNVARTAKVTKVLAGAYKRRRRVHTSNNGARERMG
jgi:hypothetical protein